MSCAERIWGVIKFMQGRKGCCRRLGLDLLAKWMDAWQLGGFACNQCDPSQIKKFEVGNNACLRFDPTFSNVFDQEIINAMPNKCKLLMGDLAQIRFGVDSSISYRLRAPFMDNESWSQTCSYMSLEMNMSFKASIINEEEFEESIILLRKRKTRKQRLQEMAQAMQYNNTNEYSDIINVNDNNIADTDDIDTDYANQLTF